jgi:hypothetical protein
MRRPLTTIALVLLMACRTDADKPDTDSLDDTGPDSTDSDGDGWVDGEDCDDSDATVNPDAEERCDGVDNDCDGEVDEDAVDASLWYSDGDMDGWGDPDLSLPSCEQPGGRVAESGDCDDSDDQIHPGAAERCNGEDDDCDGEVDEELQETWYADGDGDGFGDADETTESCDPGEGWIADGSDCDDSDALVNPGAAEICNGIDDDCDGLTDDDDDEVGSTGSWYQDADGDGWGDEASAVERCEQPSGSSGTPGDCDDGDPEVNPSALERCNGVDDDCDGSVDENDAMDVSTWYRDGDSDGYGDGSRSALACEQPSGFVADDADCDDGDDDIFPGADELCDGVDNDCDGSSDEGDAVDASSFYADTDADGYGDAGSVISACTAPSGHVADATDCDDTEAAVNPGAAEICNELDDDCDGLTDDEDPDLSGAGTWYIDYDADGYGSSAYTTQACLQPSGWVGGATDCDDTDAAVNPAGAEVCNGIDDDCDGLTDDDDSVTGTWSFHLDADGDGWGDPSSSVEACEAPSGYEGDGTDCDDGDAAVHPGAEEHCDGVDEDCDGSVDEDAVDGETWYADSDADGYGDPSVTTEACDQPSGYVADTSDCDDSDPGDLDSDGLQDCEDEDIDGDGLRNTWDADSYDDTIARGPTAGFGGDGDWEESSGGTVLLQSELQLVQAGATAGDTELEIDGAELLIEGDELLVWSAQGADAGAHQFVFVAAVVGDMVTIEPPLTDSYDSGSVIVVQRVPHWAEVTLDDAVTATPWGDAGFSPVVFRATGTVSINGSIDVSGVGFEGGEGVYGNGYDPYQGESWSGLGAAGVASANDGGGGAYPRRGDNGDSGAGGGHGSDGGAGTSYDGSAVTAGGVAYGDSELSGWHMGSGGGGGSPDAEGDGACSSEYAGDGGAGGGLVAIFAGEAIEVSGGVWADGADGDDGDSGPCAGEVGGGGGGSGGTIYLAAPSIDITGTVSSVGGLGGSSDSTNIGKPYGSAWGGAGGEGRVRLDYDSLGGATSPAAGYEGAYED